MSEPGNKPPYHITLVGDLPLTIKKLFKEAAALGKQQVYRDAWRAIERQLMTAPLEFGEKRYRLLKGQLSCHIGAIRPVAVQFAVHEERHEVFLLKAFLLGT